MTILIEFMNNVCRCTSSSYTIYTHANKKDGHPNSQALLKINEHVMSINLYIVSYILYDRHLYECIQ